MLNKEKYAKEIIEIACRGYGVAKKDNVLCCCGTTNCSECDFNNAIGRCGSKIREWANSEYVEPKINLPKDIAVDTPILVSNDGISYYRSYFKKFKGDKVICFDFGRTSWSVIDPNIDVASWEYAKLPSEEDIR